MIAAINLITVPLNLYVMKLLKFLILKTLKKKPISGFVNSDLIKAKI